MKLQKMKYRQDNKTKTFVCGVNQIICGGEFTFCGNAIPDSTMRYDNMESVGDEYKGTLKNLTCPNCIHFIRYVKSIE